MHIICPHCSSPIDVGDAATPDRVLCPSCGSTMQEDRPRQGSRVSQHQRLGKLELLARVGSGSFGEVWKARDTELSRLVAVKIPHPGLVVTPKDADRFLREGRSAAQLRHPGIVAVHDAGQADGVPYLVCDFIDGATLAELLTGQSLTFEEAARLTANVADALAYAHAMGVVHRDVKPSNIILERGGPALGKPLLMDFGLALCQDAEVTLTQEGQVLGTPGYMSPELATGRGHRADGRSDIFSLGVVLYRLLAGELPFRGKGAMLLEQVRREEPTPPRRLHAKVPRDLETIALHCLAKEPERRYQTAADLAADLRRWLKGEPIRARPVGRRERLWRWCRRNPVVAGLTAAVAMLLLAAALGATLAAVWLGRMAEQARQAYQQEEAARRRAELTLADLHTAQGLVASEGNDPAQAVLWFAHAARLAGSDPEREQANRVRVRTWGRRVPVPYRAFSHAGRQLRQLAFHPRGMHLLALSRHDRCTIWDVENDQPLPWPRDDQPVRAAAWAPDGHSLALGTPQGKVEVRSFPEGELLHDLNCRGPVRALAFSADGRCLALAGTAVRVWDVRTRTFITADLPHPQAVVTLTFNALGDRLATGCLDGRARVFAVPGKSEPLFPPVPHVAAFRSDAVAPAVLERRVAPVFLAGGRDLLTTSGSGGAVWRDGDTGRPKHAIHFPAGQAQVVEVSPDGKYFMVGGYAGAQVWDVAAGQAIEPVLPNRNFVIAAAFRPDGAVLLTAGGDRTARLWSVPGGRPLGPPLVHQAILTLAAYSPDGRLLATAQEDGLIRVWAPERSDPVKHQLAQNGSPTFARLSPDGRYVLATGAGWRREGLHDTRAYEVAAGRPTGPVLRGDGPLTDAALSPDGRTAVTLHSSCSTAEERFAQLLRPDGRAGNLRLWDRRTGKSLCEPVPMPSEPRGVAFSPDGRRLVAICGGGQVLVIDSGKGRITRRLEHGFGASSNNTYPAVCFTPDGRSVVTWGPNSDVRVWDTATGEQRYGPLAHGGVVQDARPSPDGRLLVTAARDNTARVWDVATGRPATEPLRHPDWVFSACFSPDGTQVLTGCRDGTARLWDWRSGGMVCAPFQHRDEVFGVAFTPDGRWLLTASQDGTARLWEWHTGRPVTPAWSVGGWGWSALITARGDHAVIAGQAPELRVFDLRDLAGGDDLGPDDLCLLGEVLCGQRIHGGTGAADLTTEEWMERWRAFRQRHPQHPALEPPGSFDWHGRQAEDFETSREWRTAIWHLDRLIERRPGDWRLLHRRARARAALAEWDGVVSDDTRAIALGADDRQVLLARGVAHAESGRWRQAARDYGRAIEMGADDDVAGSQYALLCLTAGDTDGYGKACAALLHRFGGTENLKIANNVAWVCGYAPAAGVDLSRALRLAEKAAARHPKKYATLNTLGAVRYRAGQVDDSIRTLNDAVKAHPEGGNAFDFLLLALAHGRRGHTEQAHRWLDRADAWIDQAREARITDPSIAIPLSWIQQAELRLLRGEAERLLRK